MYTVHEPTCNMTLCLSYMTVNWPNLEDIAAIVARPVILSSSSLKKKAIYKININL